MPGNYNQVWTPEGVWGHTLSFYKPEMYLILRIHDGINYLQNVSTGQKVNCAPPFLKNSWICHWYGTLTWGSEGVLIMGGFKIQQV